MDLEKFHLVTRLAYQAAHYKDREAIRYWEEGQWRPMSWTVFYDKIQELAKALLHHKVGVRSKLSLDTSNCAFWFFSCSL